MPTYEVEGSMYVSFKTQVDAVDGEEAVRLGQARAHDMQVDFEPDGSQEDVDITEVIRQEGIWT